eukprot:COSAG04_NODE_1235_length_7625_cov_36.004651_7_plen_274_part_00
MACAMLKPRPLNFRLCRVTPRNCFVIGQFTSYTLLTIERARRDADRAAVRVDGLRVYACLAAGAFQYTVSTCTTKLHAGCMSTGCTSTACVPIGADSRRGQSTCLHRCILARLSCHRTNRTSSISRSFASYARHLSCALASFSSAFPSSLPGASIVSCQRQRRGFIIRRKANQPFRQSSKKNGRLNPIMRSEKKSRQLDEKFSLNGPGRSGAAARSSPNSSPPPALSLSPALALPQPLGLALASVPVVRAERCCRRRNGYHLFPQVRLSSSEV